MTLQVNSDHGELGVAFASIDAIKFKPGRRHHIQYRDLGVEDATHGQMRAEVLHVGATGVREQTGWHYHNCEVQFLYVLEGTGRIEFLDGRAFDLKAGDSITIPGGTIHQEMGTGEAGRSIEITIPAKIQAVSVDIEQLRREGRLPANATV